MKIKVNDNYQFLGTTITLSTDQVYDGEYATNLPDQSIYEWVWVEGLCLKKGEYEILWQYVDGDAPPAILDQFPDRPWD